jgi:hypothetical protein
MQLLSAFLHTAFASNRGTVVVAIVAEAPKCRVNAHAQKIVARAARKGVERHGRRAEPPPGNSSITPSRGSRIAANSA